MSATYDALSPAGRVVYSVWLLRGAGPTRAQRHVVDACLRVLPAADRALLVKAGAIKAPPPEQFRDDPRFAGWEAGAQRG